MSLKRGLLTRVDLPVPQLPTITLYVIGETGIQAGGAEQPEKDFDNCHFAKKC